MRLKTRNAIGILTWAVAILATSMSSNSFASTQRVTTTDANVEHRPAVRTLSFNAPAYTGYIRPDVSEAPDPDRPSVSAVAEVDSWSMFAAVLGLIGMRLWHSGKKNMPIIK